MALAQVFNVLGETVDTAASAMLLAHSGISISMRDDSRDGAWLLQKRKLFQLLPKASLGVFQSPGQSKRAPAVLRQVSECYPNSLSPDGGPRLGANPDS